MQEEIEKISDEKLIDDTFFYLCFRAIDEAKKYKEELLKRLNWKERLIEQILYLKIDCLDSELDECVNQEKVINLIRNFK